MCQHWEISNRMQSVSCFIFSSRIEVRKTTCYCDIRRGTHVNSRVLYNLKNPIVKGIFKGCKAGAKECPGKCWNEGKKALVKQSVLNYMCRFYNNVSFPNGKKLFGYVKIDNCGTHKTYDYNKKLCCKRTTLPNGKKANTVICVNG